MTINRITSLRELLQFCSFFRGPRGGHVGGKHWLLHGNLTYVVRAGLFHIKSWRLCRAVCADRIENLWGAIMLEPQELQCDTPFAAHHSVKLVTCERGTDGLRIVEFRIRHDRWIKALTTHLHGTREKRSAHACLPCFRRIFAIEIIRDNKTN